MRWAVAVALLIAMSLLPVYLNPAPAEPEQRSIVVRDGCTWHGDGRPWLMPDGRQACNIRRTFGKVR